MDLAVIAFGSRSSDDPSVTARADQGIGLRPVYVGAERRE
jgi:hypothetical protein